VEPETQLFRTEILVDLVAGEALLEQEAREAQELQDKEIMEEPGLLRQIMAAAGEAALVS
jgi:hypothetical protein